MRGSCLCGNVSFVIDGDARPVVACHCTQCRKTSGHFVAATQVDVDKLHVEDGGSLTWFDSSAEAKRGFCGNCGSQLFWKMHSEDRISIMAGSLDGDTGLTIAKHIFTDTKGDYYPLPD